jgi:hypothetical protein
MVLATKAEGQIKELVRHSDTGQSLREINAEDSRLYHACTGRSITTNGDYVISAVMSSDRFIGEESLGKLVDNARKAQELRAKIEEQTIMRLPQEYVRNYEVLVEDLASYIAHTYERDATPHDLLIAALWVGDYVSQYLELPASLQKSIEQIYGSPTIMSSYSKLELPAANPENTDYSGLILHIDPSKNYAEGYALWSSIREDMPAIELFKTIDAYAGWLNPGVVTAKSRDELRQYLYDTVLEGMRSGFAKIPGSRENVKVPTARDIEIWVREGTV